MDLPRILSPGVGKLVRNGISVNELQEFFEKDELNVSKEQFLKNYEIKLAEATKDLAKFVGLTARVHDFLFRRESESHFPGALTVVASGFRREFLPNDPNDILSANFSFSNAYLAESKSKGKLKGPKFFLDEILSKYISVNKYERNIMRVSCFTHAEGDFDLFADYDDPLTLPGHLTKTEIVEVELFRRTYKFREYSTEGLGFLQVLDGLNPFLTGIKPPSDIFPYNQFFDVIKEGPQLTEDKLPATFWFGRRPVPLEDRVCDIIDRMKGIERKVEVDFYKSFSLFGDKKE